MRRKNRQFKVTCDIPEEFESDEDFAYALQDTMEQSSWTVTLKYFEDVDTEEETTLPIPVKKIHYGEFELEQE